MTSQEVLQVPGVGQDHPPCQLHTATSRCAGHAEHADVPAQMLNCRIIQRTQLACCWSAAAMHGLCHLGATNRDRIHCLAATGQGSELVLCRCVLPWPHSTTAKGHAVYGGMIGSIPGAWRAVARCIKVCSGASAFAAHSQELSSPHLCYRIYSQRAACQQHY